MTVRVRIPTALRQFTSGQATVDVPGVGNVGEALERLARDHAALRAHLFDEEGRLRQFVNVYLNQADVRDLARDATALKPGDTLIIVPSVAGGA